ncbi:MAG: efflux RND transporter periplasmic adaptor subunit [Bacteroidales bacterium]|nr:efflux RND transporter periplasmic adaptor subunit [Bacteroidales bacterium]
MKKKIYIVLIALVTITGFVSCSSNNANTETEEHEHNEEGEEGVVVLNKAQQKFLNLKIGNFEMRNLTTVVKINGQLEVAPKDRAGVTAILGGNVKSIKVFQGDKVKQGQVLAVLEHPDYITVQEEFATISNNLEYLKQEYERQKELFDNNVGAGKDYQKAKSEYNNAKVKYESLKSRLLLLHLSPEQVKKGKISNTINIISPISGFVNSVNIMVGIYVDTKTKMFELADNSKIHADFKVYEKDVYLLKIGQKIHFTVSNKEQKEYTAEIFAIGKQFENDTRSVHIHANILEDKIELIPGMYITGHLHTDKNYVKTLPNDAIVTQGVKSYIFIVEEENNENTKFKMTEIIKGRSDDGYTQVNFPEELPEDVRVVLNKAYYLFSDMDKDELGDDD